jgi:uncharacterized membrane protein YfcA
MIHFPMIPGVEINIILLIVLSLATGVISGFVGVGGGFIMTPALIILGFPAQYAVATVILWVMGNAIIGAIRHRQLGNVDLKLGGIMIVFMVGGVELGIRALNAAENAGMADASVLSVTICTLLIVGGSVFWESTRTKAMMDKMLRTKDETIENTPFSSLVSVFSRMHLPPIIYFPKSNVRISLWALIALGVFTGVLSSFIGIGGGIILIPSLVYLFGVPSFIAVGTNLFKLIFPTGFAAIRYSLDGNVVIFVSFIMILGSSVGIYFGSLLTKYLREVSMRYILASAILVSVLGSIFKLITIIGNSADSWLNYGMTIVTFGGLALIVCILIGLYVVALRRRNGKNIPMWVQSLVNDR